MERQVLFMQVKKLCETIYYNKEHICRGKPREAHTFYMIPNHAKTSTQHFIGDLSVAVEVVHTEQRGACKPLAITDSGGSQQSIVVIICENSPDHQVLPLL